MSSRREFGVLVVDDEEGMRLNLEKALSLEGYSVRSAASGAEALALLGEHQAHLAFVDLKLPDMDGVELIGRMDLAATKVVIITAYATVQTAVEAMKRGAVDYIQKPFDIADVAAIADRIYRSSLGFAVEAGGDGKGPLVFRSSAMRAVLETLEKVKDSDIPVLIRGESGTGKEMIARLIHQQGARATKPFMGINCAAIPAELLESELFGYEKGAFTGAVSSKPGKFEAAQDGTIFLDEIGDMPLALQTKLLRTIEERCFEPVGSVRSVPLRARIIASTNCDLRRLIEEKRFRLDLYYRLRGVTITLQPLRARREDIEPLVLYFLDRYRRRYHKGGLALARETMKFLMDYHWPGNVRELKNAVEAAVLLADGSRPLLPQDFALEEDLQPEVAPVEEAERAMIMEALRRHAFNRSLAAADLGVSRKTLYNRMKKYGLG